MGILTLYYILMWLLGVISAVNTGSIEKSTDYVVKAYAEAETGPIEEEWELYTLTAYCACEKCCGKTDGITATGTHATEGVTIAVDPDVIPYGSHVDIEGFGTYIAEDCGGAIKGNRIDIYFDSHEAALKFGVLEDWRVRIRE